MKALKALAGLLALAAVCAGGFLWLRPLDALIAFKNAQLRLSGVQRVRLGGLEAYERDRCAPGKPCSCVALIHGLGDTALTWDSVLRGSDGAAPVPEGYRLLALDLPGSEGSAPPASPSGYAIPAMARAVQESLSPVCSTWTVVGNSLGGWVAGWLALDWPKGVERLLLIDPAGLDDPTGQSEAVARLLEAPTVEKMQAFAKRAYHTPRAVPARAWPELVAAIRARPTAKIVAALRREDLLDKRAGRIRAATTILWGLSDGVIPQAVGERFARLIPGAKLETLPDCGHLPQHECPAAVTRALYSGR